MKRYENEPGTGDSCRRESIHSGLPHLAKRRNGKVEQDRQGGAKSYGNRSLQRGRNGEMGDFRAPNLEALRVGSSGRIGV